MRNLRNTALAIAALVAPTAAQEAYAADFPTVVKAILDSQTDGRLASMGGAQRQEMTNCVITTLRNLPNGKKRYIVEGTTLDEQQDRFGEVVQENRAEWKQKIASDCGRIAMRKGSAD